MTNRQRDTELLFQRLEATRLGPRAPEVEQDAARAIDAWPLLAVLAPRVEAARPALPPLRIEIGTVPEPVVATAAPAAVMIAESEPSCAAVAEPPAEAEPAPVIAVAAPMAKPASPLDQLFARLDRVAAAKAAPAAKSGAGGLSGGRVAAPRSAKSVETVEERELAREASEREAMRLFEKLARH